jgi:predicted nucleic acid-binding Zn finger protein
LILPIRAAAVNEIITYIGRSKMTFIVTATGKRGVETQKFEDMDSALTMFKLAYALGAGTVSLDFGEEEEEEDASDPAEKFFFVEGDTGIYYTSPERCSCPAFVYHGQGQCKHMRNLWAYNTVENIATYDDYRDDMARRYGMEVKTSVR